MRFIRAGLVAVLVGVGWTVTAAAGEPRCRPTPAQVVVEGFMPVVGEGPVYATLFSTGPVPFRHPGDTWGAAKVLWIGDPAYGGTVVVRGRRTDAPGDVRFDHKGRLQPSLRLTTLDIARGSWVGSAAGWHDWPSAVRVKRSGCYELTVRTSEGVDRIVFRAERRER